MKAAAGFGAAVIMLGVALVVIHVSIRTTLLFGVVGFVLVFAWLWADSREEAQKKPKSLTTDMKAACNCQVCHHDNVNTCNVNRCACCLDEKDGKVIGHHISGLQ